MKRFFFALVVLISSALLSPMSVMADEATSPEAATAAMVNINTASAEALTMLPGIGDVKAEAIVAWRDQHGPFEQVEQLLEVNGVGETTLESLRSQVQL
jgi:competence protein ComEA